MLWIWSAAALLVSTLSLFATLRRDGRERRRREVWFDVEAENLQPAHLSELDGRLAVSIDGRPVKEPHAVRLTLWVSTPSDISSADFDGGEALTLHLGVRVFGQLDGPTVIGLERSRVSLTLDGVLEVQPVLLKNGYGVQGRVITQGAPSPIVGRNCLKDADLHIFGDAAKVKFRSQLNRYRSGLFVFILGLVAFLGVFVLDLTKGSTDLEPVLAYMLPALILVPSGIAIMVLGLLNRTNVDKAVRAVPVDFGDRQARAWSARLRSDR